MTVRVHIVVPLEVAVDDLTDAHVQALNNLADVMRVQAEDGLYTLGSSEGIGPQGEESEFVAQLNAGGIPRLHAGVAPSGLHVPTTDCELDRFHVRWSGRVDDPDLVCEDCDVVVCQVEHGDVLAVLARVALAHRGECQPDLSVRAVTTRILLDVLTLVKQEYPGPPVTEDEVAPMEGPDAWSLEDRQLVYEWAIAVHLAASDNDDVEVPPLPAVLARRGRS